MNVVIFLEKRIAKSTATVPHAIHNTAKHFMCFPLATSSWQWVRRVIAIFVNNHDHTAKTKTHK